MAYEGQQMNQTFTAGGDLSAKQYHFVKLSANNTVVICAAATDKPIGVLQNDPASGGEANVCMVGVTKVSADASLTYGTLIGTSADGQADAKTPGTDTTEYTCGQILSGVSNAAEIATAAINCLNLGRAA